MSEIKLLKCPFCGGDNVGVWHNRPVSPLIADSYEVRCYNCNFGLRPERLKDKAIGAWNTRKPIQNIVERMEVKKGTVVIDGKKMYQEDYFIDIDEAIEIVMEEGGIK